MKVYEYKLRAEDEQQISLPKGAEVLSVAEQRGEICVWALVDEFEKQTEDVTFVIAGTGHPVVGFRHARFIGTVLLHNGALVFHVFEVGRE